MDSSLLSYPVSLILAVAFCLICYISYGTYRRSKLLSGVWTRTISMGVLAVVSAIEGTFRLELQNTLLLVIPLVTVTYLCAMAALDGIICRRRLMFILPHLGLFLALLGGIFGACDSESANIVAAKDQKISYAVSEKGLTVPLDFSITLKEFKIDYYGSGKEVKQYRSRIEFSEPECYDAGRNGGSLSNDSGISGTITKNVSVNHPCWFKGWVIYQSDYDHDNCSYSVLRMVKDPWLAVTMLGMLMLAVGAILGLGKTWYSRALIPVAVLLTLLFGAASVARINLGTLPPALRSIWFVPHLIVYMIAYSLLAIAIVCCIWGAVKESQKMNSLAVKLLSTSSAMLILGMLCGAVWAKMAWGECWTWDLKECWAATTWIITLIGTHMNKCKWKLYIFVVVISFLAMQITWYGVKWLPSAQYSMHTYNIR